MNNKFADFIWTSKLLSSLKLWICKLLQDIKLTSITRQPLLFILLLSLYSWNKGKITEY